MSTVFRVDKTANFTVMSNIHLKDKNLSFKAKGLLSVILSLPPEWDYTFTGLAHVAADGVDSVRTAVRELEKFGYITRRQLRDERGRMSQNEYRVYENPQQNPAYFCENFNHADCSIAKKNPAYVRGQAENYNCNSSKQNSDYSEQFCNTKQSSALARGQAENYNCNSSKRNSDYSEQFCNTKQSSALACKQADNYGYNSQSPENSKSAQTDNIFLCEPSAVLPSKEIPSAELPTAYTFNILNTNKSNTYSSIHSVRASRVNDRNDGNDFFENKNIISVNEREKYLRTIHENIEYDSFREDKKVDELVGIMADVLSSTKGTVRVNGGELPTDQVKKCFLELKRAHIEHVLTSLENNTSVVRNIRAYLITALYNAPTTVGCFRQKSVTTSAPAYAPTSAPPLDSFKMQTSSIDMDAVMAQIKARYKSS